MDLLTLPTPDLTIRAKNIHKREEAERESNESYETETEESGINTWCTSDDVCVKENQEKGLSIKEILNKHNEDGKSWEENSDESISIENLHFGQFLAKKNK